jgi:hypothetical protein
MIGLIGHYPGCGDQSVKMTHVQSIALKNLCLSLKSLLAARKKFLTAKTTKFNIYDDEIISNYLYNAFSRNGLR